MLLQECRGNCTLVYLQDAAALLGSMHLHQVQVRMLPDLR